jgi:pimeloyl-ACP methyl ester carboxylesterase
MIPLVAQRLHHEVHGAGEPLLLIHGTGGSLRVWDPLVDRLGARRAVIAVDLPGFGLSPRMKSGTSPTPAGFARVLAGFLQELGHHTAHVAGNSVGGWTALEMAKLGVTRSVVALAPAGLWAARRTPLYTGLSVSATRLSCRLLDPLMPALLSHPLGRKLAMWQQFAHPERLPPRAAVEAARGFAYSPGFDKHLIATGRERFVGGRSIEVPVTVAFGERDRLLLRSQSRHRVELPLQTHWFELPDCGHVPTYDDPVLVARVLLEGSAPPYRPRLPLLDLQEHDV